MDDFARNNHDKSILGDETVDEFGTDFELSDEAQQVAESLVHTSENPYEQVSEYGKDDQEVLYEAGIDVDVDGTYDMATRQGREALAKDIHNMRGAFAEIASRNEEVVEAQADAYERVIRERGLSIPVTRPPAEVMVEGSRAINEKVDEIEEDVYNHLAVVGATRREVGEEEVCQAVASAVDKYHAEVDRYEMDIDEGAIEALMGERGSYRDLDDTLSV